MGKGEGTIGYIPEHCSRNNIPIQDHQPISIYCPCRAGVGIPRQSFEKLEYKGKGTKGLRRKKLKRGSANLKSPRKASHWSFKAGVLAFLFLNTQVFPI